MQQPDQPPRDLAWPNCFNARDLGGYETADGRRTRWRALVRADNLCLLTPAGRDALVGYGVRTIVDLLSPSEHNGDLPHPFRHSTAAGAVPRYVHVPLVDDDDEETVRLVDRAPSREASYRAYLDRCGRQLAAAVRAIAEAPAGGVVVHCHAGTDRVSAARAVERARIVWWASQAQHARDRRGAGVCPGTLRCGSSASTPGVSRACAMRPDRGGRRHTPRRRWAK